MVVDEYKAIFDPITMKNIKNIILGIEIANELTSIKDLRKQALKKWKTVNHFNKKPS